MNGSSPTSNINVGSSLPDVIDEDSSIWIEDDIGSNTVCTTLSWVRTVTNRWTAVAPTSHQSTPYPHQRPRSKRDMRFFVLLTPTVSLKSDRVYTC